MPQDSFDSFAPFRRDLKTPCLIFCTWRQCGHCHQMAPFVKKAQTTLRGKCPVYVADAEQHESVMKTFKVTGYPELFFLGPDRRLKRYKGPRSAEGIVSFARSHIQ